MSKGCVKHKHVTVFWCCVVCVYFDVLDKVAVNVTYVKKMQHVQINTNKRVDIVSPQSFGSPCCVNN